MKGRVTHFFFGPREGSKGQLLNSSYKVNFKGNLNMFSQIKYIKHIEREFHSGAWIMS